MKNNWIRVHSAPIWMQTYSIELVIIPILLLFFSAFLYIQLKGFQLDFIDTDDYMRVVRIREFFQNYDLCSNIIKRCNVPYGCSLHWTRFYDFFIIIPSFILNFFIDSINRAVDYVCFGISPVVRIITAMVFLRMLHTNNLMNRDSAFLCLIAFAVHPIITAYGNFGRPDHHAFIVLFMMLFLFQSLKAAKNDFQKYYTSSACFAVLCIWISPETLIPLLLVDAVVFLYELQQKRQDDYSKFFQFVFLKSQKIILGLELLIVLSAATNLLFCQKNSHVLYDAWKLLKITFIMEVIRRSFNISSPLLKRTQILLKKHFEYCFSFAWLIIYFFALESLKILPNYYDEISTVHWALYAYITYFFGVLTYRKNIFCQILSILLGAVLFFTTYPKFFLGMGADVTPYVKQIWLYKVNEMRSPLVGEDWLMYVVHTFFIAVSVIWKLYEILILKKYKGCLYKEFFWLFFSSLSASYALLAGFANRMLLYSALFSIPLIVDFGMNYKFVPGLSRWIRMFNTIFMTVLYIFVTAAKCDSCDSCADKTAHLHKNRTNYLNNLKKPENTYTSRELFTTIDQISATPTVIMAHSNYGPSILYYTKHCVVGAPYHRQQKGIIASYEVMEAPYDEKKIKSILKKIGASYIFIEGNRKQTSKAGKQLSKGFVKNSKEMSLSQMALRGSVPQWLEQIKIPEKFENVIILKVNLQ